MKKLGENQMGCLRSLKQFHSWPGSGWTWSNYSGTLRIMESLERRGLVERFDRAWGGPVFRLTEAGRKALED